MFLKDVYFALPLVVVLLGTGVVLAFVLLRKKNCSKACATGFLAFTLFISWLSSVVVFQKLEGPEKIFFEESFIISSFSFWIESLLLLAFSIAAFLFQKNKAVVEEDYVKLTGLLLCSLSGSLTVLYSNSFLLLFLGFEVFSISFLFIESLAKSKVQNESDALATFKSHIVSSLPSSFFLLGLTLVFGSLALEFEGGSFLYITKIRELPEDFLKNNTLFSLGSVFMLLASFYRLGVFPFKNAFSEAETKEGGAITFFSLACSKTTALFFLIKLMMAGLLVHTNFLQWALQWGVVLSMIFGALCALQKRTLKSSLICLSTVSFGYIMMSVIGFGYDGEGSLDSLVYYLFSYVFFMGLIIYVVQGLEREKGAGVSIFELDGLYRLKPIDSALLLIGVLGISGLPPFVGFLTVVYVLKAAIKTGFYWVSFWSLISLVNSMNYYFEIVLRVLFKSSKSHQYMLWSSEPKKQKVSSLGFLVLMFIVLISMSFVYYFPLNS